MITSLNKTLNPSKNIKEDAFFSILESWSKDACKFVEEAIGVEKPTTQQKQALKELTKIVNAKIKYSIAPDSCTEDEIKYASKRGISIMSGQGTGKDAFASWAILWFLTCFPYPKIPCTAPTGHQLKDVLWAEISKWMRHSEKNGNNFITNVIEWQSNLVYMKKASKPKAEWFAVPRTCSPNASQEEQAETLAGFHEEYQMIVADEASGIPEAVFKPLEGTMTGKCNITLMIFNPTKNSGYAVESHVKGRRDWVVLRWNGEESELVAKSHIEYMKNKYGEDSNVYRIRVLGLPPKAETDTLIPYEWIINAAEREVYVDDDEPEKVGLDIGGGGDKSIMLFRRGGKVTEIIENNSEDTMQIVGWAGGHLSSKEPDSVFVDLIGIGKGVFDRLKEIGYPNIIGVNTSNAARKNGFQRLRDELWWKLREEFEKGTISIPNDDELTGELSCIKFDYDSRGRLKVESKKDLRKRGLKSPNKADALVMTYYFQDVILKKDMRLRYRAKKETYDDRGWMGS